MLNFKIFFKSNFYPSKVHRCVYKHSRSLQNVKKKAAHRVSRKQHDVKNPSTPCFIQFNGLKWAHLQISTTFSIFFRGVFLLNRIPLIAYLQLPPFIVS